MQDPFADLVPLGTRLVWEAAEPGFAWFPAPDQGGPLPEAALFLLRALYDLVPAGGAMLAAFEDHEVLRGYADKAELGLEPVPATWVRRGTELARAGEPGILVRLKRFGDLVELYAFANRGEQGLPLTAFLLADEGAVEPLTRTLRRVVGEAGDPTAHVAAWGVLDTPGPARRAGLTLLAGTHPPGELAARLAARARGLGAGLADPARRRRLVLGWLGG